MNRAAISRKGGVATYNKHGRIHMQVIGRAGYEATVWKHFGGDYALHHQMLVGRARVMKLRLRERAALEDEDRVLAFSPRGVDTVGGAA